MTTTHGFRPYSALCAASLALLSACATDRTSSPLDPTTPQISANIVALSSALIIVPGASAGSFANLISANNSGRALTEFWDNNSADVGPSALQACNIGFYASGTLTGDCINEAPGSAGNQGGYVKYFGDGPDSRDATGFMFAGNYSYDVTLKGSFAGGASEVGWFTKTGAGVYTFNVVPAWSARTINSTLNINTGGAAWGFFIRNTTLTDGGCANPNTNCSDAEGGFDAKPFQQFALFENSAEDTFLVGTEDNLLELYPAAPNSRDSDYNDYIFSVKATAILAGQGCSPGYWKTHSAWPAPYTPGTLFSAVFENAFPGKTLQQVLALQGGGLNALGRQTVSALLNAQANDVNYELSPLDVITQFNAVFPGADYTTLKNSFEALTDINGRICPLN
jgi:hypothetical protein